MVTGNVQSNRGSVELPSGSRVIGNVLAAEGIEVGAKIIGNARAGDEVEDCSRVTGTCTERSRPVPFSVPATRTFTWNAANYSSPTVWPNAAAFRNWLSSNSSNVSGVHFVPGALNINTAIRITGKTVIVTGGALSITANVTTNVSSATTALFVSTGDDVSVSGSVTGNSSLALGFFSPTDKFLSTGRLNFNGWIAALGEVKVNGDTTVVYRAVNDPGIA